MVQTPFPELKAFETPPRLPALSDLLASLPAGPTQSSRRQKATTKFSSLPVGSPPPAQVAFIETKKWLAQNPLPQEGQIEASADKEPTPQAPPMPSPFASAVASAMEDPEDEVNEVSKEAPLPPVGTDLDLRRALGPVMEDSLEQVLYAPDKGLHTYLEPMLRSTVRRAIAEQIDAAVQFRSTGTVDRMGWRLKALMTSQSYEDVVFQSTRRYQVEEAFLLRSEDFSLVSFASHDPARHASEKRVSSTVKMLSAKLLDQNGILRKTFDLEHNRVGIIRAGQHTLLVAIVRGRSNALVRADLDFVLRQAEDRFGERLQDETDAFLHVLQPILEGCLLIQSPAPPN